MKIIKRDLSLIQEEMIYTDLNEKEALALCENLNRYNLDETIYFMAMPDDYIENNF